MIPLEGRVLAGLDEFMLRIGHLKVLASVAIEIGGSWSRIEREFSRFITESLPVPADQIASVTEYLVHKRLCPAATEASSQEEERDYRYPELVAESDGHGGQRIRSQSGEVRVWRQDLWMSSPEVRSKVGAVTVHAKSGSKTGISHIRDWATLIEFFTNAGQLSPEGHLAVRLDRDVDGETWHTNPYRIGFERLVFAQLVMSADIDLFARFAPKLLRSQGPLRKSAAADLFSEALAELSADVDSARFLSSARQYRLLQQLREIQGQQKAGAAKASTTWHRAASRLETYVDIGLLDKGRGGEAERYEYTYYPTTALERCVKSLSGASSGDDWLEEHVASTVFDMDTSATALPHEHVEPLLRRIAPCLGRPISLLPISAIALGIAWLTAKESRPISLRAARLSIEEFAKARPEVARLSRGGSGARAEFLSVLVKLERG